LKTSYNQNLIQQDQSCFFLDGL